MQLQHALKLVLVTMFLILALLLTAYLSLFGWNQVRLSQIEHFINNLQKQSALQYEYGHPPISLGDVNDPHNAYFHLTLRFRIDSTEGHPNLFQTASFNKGLRIEFGGTSAVIIVADSNLPDKYRVIFLSNAIKMGQWYTLDLEAVNQGYIHAQIEGNKVARVATTGINMELSQILLGQGFNQDRNFKGQIENIVFTKGNANSTALAVIRHLPNSQHELLAVVANLGIFISALICILIEPINRTLTRTGRYIQEHILEKSFAIIFSLLAIQLVLLVALPAYRIVLVTYIFLFIVGINLYLTITPAFLKERFFHLLFIPFNGLIVVSILGSYFIGFSVSIKYLVPTLLVVTLLAGILNYKLNNEKFAQLRSELQADFSSSLIWLTLIATPLILCLISSVLFSEYTTSPYRVGPDLASYAKMAQYLLDGGTWAEANLRVSEFVGMTPGEINRYSDATMSWPFMYYFRWGLTAFQATVATISFSSHIYEVAFVSMAIPYLFLCGLVLFWLRSRMGLGVAAALLGLLAFALNPNVLNLWYEGFYGNAFALCFFVLIIFIFLQLKKSLPLNKRETVQYLLLISTVVAASLLSYGEGVFFVLPPFLMCVFIVDSIMQRSIHWKPYLLILGGACIGLLIVTPCGFIVQWAILTFKQLSQEGGNGYMQPLWAYPHEILGFSSIYLNATPEIAGHLLPRSTINIIYGVIFSALILYSLIIFFWKQRSENNALYITTVIIIMITAGLVYYKSRGNNYTYMKMYVFFLPILFITFWSSLATVYEKHLTNVCSKHVFFIFLAIPIVINGLVYIAHYDNEATLIKREQISLHNETKKIDFDNVIMYPVSIQGNRFFYPAILPTPWIIPIYWDSDHWKDKPYFNNFLNHKVYLFFEKEIYHSYTPDNKNIVFQNSNYLIVDSGKLLNAGIKQDGSIQLNTYTGAVIDSVNKK